MPADHPSSHPIVAPPVPVRPGTSQSRPARRYVRDRRPSPTTRAGARPHRRTPAADPSLHLPTRGRVNQQADRFARGFWSRPTAAAAVFEAYEYSLELLKITPDM